MLQKLKRKCEHLQFKKKLLNPERKSWFIFTFVSIFKVQIVINDK